MAGRLWTESGGVASRNPSLVAHHADGDDGPSMAVPSGPVTDESCMAAAMTSEGIIPPLPFELWELICSFGFSPSSSKLKTLRKEACWIVSNVTAGSPSQVQLVFDVGLVPILFDLLDCGDYGTATATFFPFLFFHFRSLSQLCPSAHTCDMPY